MDSNFLDLFAGSGAIGIEALSRGAKSCVFIENDSAACSLIRRNLEKTRLGKNAQTINSDAKKAICNMRQKFDIIFADPPYSQNLVNIILSDIAEWDLLSENGFIVIEISKKDELPEDFLQTIGLSIFKHKKYSSTQLIFIEKA